MVIISWFVLVLMLIYLFAIMPRITPRPMQEFRGWYYAHRGFHDNNTDVPENSKKAFALAVKNGYGIELDIQLTKDRHMVVIHDERVDRTTNGIGEVCSYTLSELKKLSIDKEKYNQKISTIEEVFDLLEDTLRAGLKLNIELKNSRINYRFFKKCINLL